MTGSQYYDCSSLNVEVVLSLVEMGGCFGSHSRREPTSINGADGITPHPVSIGKNQPLRHEILKWKSDVPLTDGQLRSKRDEFWDTAPAFEGRKEIWDALKAASLAAESNDYTLAQAIIDGANISLPNGTLTDGYDELGNRYQLPIYCLSAPVNMIEGNAENETTSDSESASNGLETILRLRLSTTGREVKLAVRSADSILCAKRKLQAQESVDPSCQRWFFGGKLLNDKMKLEEVKIPTGYVVQVVISSHTPTIVES
ncbi:Ubiquitin domain-containing protein 2 [Chamberlinius hualienensis]